MFSLPTGDLSSEFIECRLVTTALVFYPRYLFILIYYCFFPCLLIGEVCAYSESLKLHFQILRLNLKHRGNTSSPLCDIDPSRTIQSRCRPKNRGLIFTNNSKIYLL